MRIKFAPAVLALALSSPALGSIAQPEPDEEIVIVGETMRQAEKRAKAYVAEVGIAVGERPTARWVDPICPKAIGLSPDQEQRVVARVRQLIRGIGALPAKDKCAPNMMITFTDNPVGVVETVRRKGHRALDEVPKQVLADLVSGSAPVRWWYQTDIRSRDGTSASGAINPALLRPCDRCDAPNPVNLDNNGNGMLNVSSSSHISTQGIRTISYAAVVIDVNAAKGASLESIIDYAALVSLAEIRFGASPPLSILSLFDAQAPVTELSKRDLAMLTGLYRIHLDRKAEQQRRTLVNRILKTDLEAPQTRER